MTITWQNVQSQVKPTQAPSPDAILRAFDNLNVFEGRQLQVEKARLVERQENADAFDRMQEIASLQDMDMRQENDRTRLAFSRDENTRADSEEARKVLKAGFEEQERIKQDELYKLRLSGEERKQRNNKIADDNADSKAITKVKYTKFLSSIPAELDIGSTRDIARNYISIQGLDNSAADEVMAMVNRRETSSSREMGQKNKVLAARKIITDKEEFLRDQQILKNTVETNKLKKIEDSKRYFNKSASIPDNITSTTDSTGNLAGFDSEDRNNVMNRFLRLQREYGNINQNEANKLFKDNIVDGKFFMESFERMFLNTVQHKKYKQNAVGDVDPTPEDEETTAGIYFRGLAKKYPGLTPDMLDGLRASVVSKDGKRIDSERAENMIKQLVSSRGS